MSAALVLGTVGVLLNQVFIWPQVRRARRTVEGVASLTVLGGLLARLAWSVYGARLDDLALVLGNITVSAGFLVLLLLLARSADRPLALVGGAAAVVAVVAASVVNLPQMVRALSDRQQLAGVSVPTYLLIALASACWLSYGVVVHEPLISAPHYLLLPTALVTAWVAGRSQRRSARG